MFCNNKDLIESLYKEEIFQKLSKPITLKGGKLSHFYADFRKLYTNPKLLDKVATQLSSMIPKDTNYLAGTPLGAIPITTLLSNKLNIPFLLVRQNAKSHGSKRLIEGEIVPSNATITIIEDVITTGQSSMETYKKLKEMFPLAKINIVVSIFNRLEYDPLLYSFKIRSLLNFNDILLNYYNLTKPKYSTAQKLFNIVEKKLSNLIYSADQTDSSQLLIVLEQVAPYIVAVKLHTDSLKDSVTPQFISKLIELSNKYEFIIIEDRKFTDIGSTLKNQLTSSLNIVSWADAVTVFPCVTKSGINLINNLDLAPIIIEELTTYQDNDNNPYSFKSKDLISSFSNEKFIGTIGQYNSLKWQFSPGISLDQRSDDINQNYRTPEEAVKTGTDFFIVGRSIFQSETPKLTAKLYREKCWKAKLLNI
jgi:uridine monophosphate synthetase